MWFLYEMPKVISISDRKPLRVDAQVRNRSDVYALQFQASSNWDGVFTPFETVNKHGKMSRTVIDPGSIGSQFRDQTRFLFNPNDYTTTVPAVNDDLPFWIKIAPVSRAGVVGTAGDPHLVLPFKAIANRSFNINGVAPNVTAANAIEIVLPFQCNNISLKVTGANDLLFSFDRNGYEYIVSPETTNYTNFEKAFASFSSIFVRGSGGVTNFYANISLRTSIAV